MTHFKAGQILTAGELNTAAHTGSQLIEEQIIESAVSEVTFSSISQDFRNLRVILTGGVDTGSGTQLEATFNGDTASNYNYSVFVMRSNDVYEAFPTPSDNSIEVAFFNQGDLLNSAELTVFGYSRTDREKPLMGQAISGLTSSTNSEIIFNHVQARWQSTAAITQLTFTPRDGNNIQAGSIFQLYAFGAES